MLVPDAMLKETSYNYEVAAEAIRRSGVPMADDFFPTHSSPAGGGIVIQNGGVSARRIRRDGPISYLNALSATYCPVPSNRVQ